MTTSWLVLCAAGGHEREAARIVNRNDGAAYIPVEFPVVPEAVTYRPIEAAPRILLPGYVFATWLGSVPWHRLDIARTSRDEKLIYGYLAPAGSEEPARVFQHEIDLMEAYAVETAKKAGVPRHKVGDLIPQKLGLTGAEITWRVTEIVDGLKTLQTVMLGKIIERKVREAA